MNDEFDPPRFMPAKDASESPRMRCTKDASELVRPCRNEDASESPLKRCTQDASDSTRGRFATGYLPGEPGSLFGGVLNGDAL